MLYTDETAHICTTYLSPLECFVVYDDSVARKPLYGVRYYRTTDNTLIGSVYSQTEEIPFSDAGGGRQVDEENLHTIRSDRVIHVPPMDADDINAIRVEFLQKPAADATQENLLNRLEDHIFAQSMVANISDESFGSSSGTALAYKLQPMKNQAAAKSRKFASAMNQRWRLIAAHPFSKLAADDWMQITYRFTQNAPKNLLEEAQTAAQMAGITSKETQLSVISAVDDPQTELRKIDAENGAEPVDTLRSERETSNEESGVLE